MMFNLHTRLRDDTYRIGSLALSEFLLMDNALFPWVILAPRVAGISEVTELKPSQQHQLMDEITRVSAAMQTLYRADKMNVAALGNQVTQLHIHVIARFHHDTAWPNPVWGQGAKRYAPQEREARIRTLRQAIGL